MKILTTRKQDESLDYLVALGKCVIELVHSNPNLNTSAFDKANVTICNLANNIAGLPGMCIVNERMYGKEAT